MARIHTKLAKYSFISITFDLGYPVYKKSKNHQLLYGRQLYFESFLTITCMYYYNIVMYYCVFVQRNRSIRFLGMELTSGCL